MSANEAFVACSDRADPVMEFSEAQHVGDLEL
jgi:hypothetical protein